MTGVRIHTRGRLMLALVAAAPAAVYAGFAAGHPAAGVLGGLACFGFFVRLARAQRAQVKQARHAVRMRRRNALRMREPEVWLERFREELDEWDMTVESLLAAAGPEPAHGFSYITPAAFYDQDADEFGEML